MLLGAAAFWQFILAVHIVAVVVAFGVLFIYPLLGVIGLRLDPQAMPSFHRFQLAVHTRVQSPGLGVVVLAGIYLASYLHQWGEFFVGWGLAASIVIGGIGGAYIAPRERRLAELAEREVVAVPAAAGGAVAAAGGGVSWSDEYRAAARQADLARLVQLVLAAATILFMSLQL
jgi:hypothetical protein